MRSRSKSSPGYWRSQLSRSSRMRSGLSLAGNGSFQDELVREPELSSISYHLKAGGQRGWVNLTLQQVGNVSTKNGTKNELAGRSPVPSYPRRNPTPSTKERSIQRFLCNTDHPAAFAGLGLECEVHLTIRQTKGEP